MTSRRRTVNFGNINSPGATIRAEMASKKDYVSDYFDGLFCTVVLRRCFLFLRPHKIVTGRYFIFLYY